MQKISKTLQGEEKTLLQVKYKSTQIAKLSDADLLLHVQALLLKIHVITGWKIPESEGVSITLEDQFFKKLREDYAHCNTDEIEYAFRSYGTGVKDWGKDINLSLVDEVMEKYLARRKDLSEMEERMKTAGEIEWKPSEEDLLNMKRETVEARYQSFLEGKTSFVMQPADGLAILALDGFCDMDLHEDFLQNAVKAVKKDIQQKHDEAVAHHRFELAKQLTVEMHDVDENNAMAAILAKKMALVYCFYKFKQANFKKIYEV